MNEELARIETRSNGASFFYRRSGQLEARAGRGRRQPDRGRKEPKMTTDLRAGKKEIFDHAVKVGKLAASERPRWEKEFDQDPEGTKAWIDVLAAVNLETTSPAPRSSPRSVAASAPASGVGQTAQLVEQITPAARPAFLEAKSDREALAILNDYPDTDDGRAAAFMSFPEETERLRSQPLHDFLHDATTGQLEPMTEAQEEELYAKRFGDGEVRSSYSYKVPRFGTGEGFYAPRPKK